MLLPVRKGLGPSLREGRALTGNSVLANPYGTALMATAALTLSRTLPGHAFLSTDVKSAIPNMSRSYAYAAAQKRAPRMCGALVSLWSAEHRLFKQVVAYSAYLNLLKLMFS